MTNWGIFATFYANPSLFLSFTSSENPRLQPVALGASGPFAAPQTYVPDFLRVVKNIIARIFALFLDFVQYSSIREALKKPRGFNFRGGIKFSKI